MAGEKLREAAWAAYRKQPVWPISGTPPEWIQRSHPEFVPSLYAEPAFEWDVTGIGEIKGRPDYIARGFRKAMQVEHGKMKAVRAGKDVGERGKFLRDLLTGVWWHGRKTAPPADEMVSMAATRRGTTLLGEPVGSSLTKHPAGTAGFGPEMLRTKVLFGEDPLDVVLFHQWEPHAQVMNEVYGETVEEFAKEVPSLRGGTHYSAIASKVGVKKFNDRLTRKLEERGYKGILYSPEERYGEYELKMFPGGSAPGMGSSWAWPLDVRRKEGKEIKRWNRMFGKKLRATWAEEAKTGQYHHLKEHYRQIDIGKHTGAGGKLRETVFDDVSLYKTYALEAVGGSLTGGGKEIGAYAEKAGITFGEASDKIHGILYSEKQTTLANFKEALKEVVPQVPYETKQILAGEVKKATELSKQYNEGVITHSSYMKKINSLTEGVWGMKPKGGGG